MNDTPKSERPHIAFFGRTNVGKSSLVNALTGQDLALVSDVRGTTTDPVEKAMEILPFGPVLLIDTPGLDDTTSLGAQRVLRAHRVLGHTDLAILVLERSELSAEEAELLKSIRKAEIPYRLVLNKCDEVQEGEDIPTDPDTPFPVSAKKGTHIARLRELIAKDLVARQGESDRPLIRDLVPRGSVCILVIPIDSAAPKGRLILPQQQVLRDLLEGHAQALCVAPEELSAALTAHTPALVVCDSQIFSFVAETVPEDIPLTSFSILMARYKGTLKNQLEGVAAIRNLTDNDCILMAEGCTHHRQCDDIGTVKIPRWLKAHTGKNLRFETCSGKSFPLDLTDFALVILCGGCMLNAREMQYRLQLARSQGVPVTNYGLCIASMKGILARSTAMLKEANIVAQREDHA
ncbi:MAG: [Desulfovibrionaceae bacterium]|nr:[FeFe] hydrogenase H-cluster maturation GTPase HydF [Desulfovibrionaceae bacterium]